MKRLQEGDECYVRSRFDNNIYKIEITYEWLITLYQLKYWFRVVYPTEAIKRLAK